MRFSRGIAWLAGVLLTGLAVAPARGGPVEREAWHALIAEGTRYGSLHTQVVRLPDGNYRYERTLRLKLDVLGTNREEMEERRLCVVTPTYEPVSLELTRRASSGETRIKGGLRDGLFEVVRQSQGVEHRERFKPGAGELLEACLEDWLADRPEEFKEGEVTVVADETGERKSVRVSRLETQGSETTWLVDHGKLDGEQRLVIGAGGLVRSNSADDPGDRVERCTAEEAKDLKPRKLEGKEMLAFPLNQDLGVPERLESLVVELRWKGIPLDQFRLADARQQLKEHTEAEGEHRTLVSIEPSKPVTNAPRIPIDAPEFAPYLGRSQFIEPEHPQIVSTARQAVAGKEHNALEAARALSTWVSKYIEPVMIAETLSGPEVLACRKGKCSEYSTLFASLARSVGIPTRIVLGERMSGNQWIGHMWNEVYVGEWVTVDSSVDEVGTSFSLLKLIDAPTVEGTQPLRRKLPSSLALKVESFRKQEGPLREGRKLQTGIEGKVYTNADLLCRLTTPEGGWSIEDKSGPGAVLLRLRPPGQPSDEVQLHFVAFPLPPAIPPQLLLKARRASYQSRLKSFEVRVDEATRVNGLAGHQLEFSHKRGEGKPRRAREVVWRSAHAGFLLALDSPESEFEMLKKAMAQWIKGFESLETK